MALSPNYSWPEPDNTSLVKDGALAMRTLGNAIDTTMATMTPKSTYTAKGSIAAATAASTPANLAVGANGETLVADSSTATGLRYQADFAAGKNKIINGDFGIWQRGTSFSGAIYNADRWVVLTDATVTTSQQAFTAGTAPVAGYESQYFQRTAKSAGGTYGYQEQRIEDVRTFAGQTVTLSFWAKADAAITYAPQLGQYFGTGGSTGTQATVANVTLTTSWARYSVTISVPSISGKTIGAGNYLFIRTIGVISSSAYTIDIWGVQVEAGSVATAFQTATGTIQGELAACQRYYYRATVDTLNRAFGMGQAYGTTAAYFYIQFPVTMRSLPTGLEQSGTASHYRLTLSNWTSGTLTSVPAFNSATNIGSLVTAAVASGLTAGNATSLNSESSSAYLGWSAEL